MIDAAQFHFLRPEWLAALVPAGLLVWFLYRRQLRGGSWESVCDAALLPHVLIGAGASRRPWPYVLMAAGAMLAIVALAGPAWSRLPQPVFSASNALVIALDLSRSMDATDVSPSRIARARYKVADILKRRQEGQTALVVYAGSAFTVTPLTDDTATISAQVQALSPDIMPVQGARADQALSLAGDLLRQAGVRRGDILLVTDEVDPNRSAAVARALRDRGYRVSILGVGTESGVPVPMADGGFLKDADGDIVIPVLDAQPMRDLAAAGGGRYLQMSLDDSDIDTLEDLFAVDPLAEEVSETSLHADVWREQGPWLLLPLLPLAALAFRRGYLAVILIFLLPAPRPAQAFEWGDLWSRPDQRAQRALEAGDHARAAELFRDPAWKGAARYRAGDYDGALESLGDAGDIESLYNRGNALARLGRYPEALDAYREVLKRDPDHEDARHNKELIEEQMNAESPPQSQQDGDGGRQDQDGQTEQDSDRQGQDGQRQQDGDRQARPQQEPAQEPGEGEDPQRADAAPQPAQGDEAKSGPRRPEAGREPGEQSRREQQQARAGARKDGEPRRPEGPAVSRDDLSPDEEQIAREQWLRRIPDDPAGLLRRKFLYQYQQRAEQAAPEDKQW